MWGSWTLKKITTMLQKHNVHANIAQCTPYVDDSSSQRQWWCRDVVSNHASTQCGKHNKEVIDLLTGHSTSIQCSIILPLMWTLNIHCSMVHKQAYIYCTCAAAQPVSVLKERYSHQLPFEMHCLGEVYHTRSHVSITTQAVIDVPTTEHKRMWKWLTNYDTSEGE